MLPPFWDYGREYDELRDEILAAVDRVFRSGQLILGPEGLAFERQMAECVGVTGGVGVNSGTDAIYIALAALGVKAGDEVITVPNTAVPTVSAIQTLGARPVLVDIRDNDFLMDVEQVEAAITPRTRAIIPVHLYGQCVDLDPLMSLAERHGLKVMEDCAQSQGALYKGRPSGSIGHASSFSFYPTKLLGGYGDGGMVLSRDQAVIDLARSLRFYGMEQTYYAERHGFNSRLDEVQAAILSLKLPRVEGWIERRRGIAGRYRRGFAGCGLEMPVENNYGRHVYHLFVVEAPRDRDEFLARIQARGLKCGVQYRWPIHLMRGYHDLGYRSGQFPVAEKKAQRIFSLPIYPHLTDDEVDEVIDLVRKEI
ncbi:aminotransferase EvaB [Bradyrhizobium sp. GM2.2]|uniref:DegT/DnrJ/EryC1/StrS family aminotransferase n=1 Tax=Bradyrhizobium sp. GM2.2 TaxID=3156358 RepID=UPI0033907FC5